MASYWENGLWKFKKKQSKNPQNKQLQSRQATRIELVSVSKEHQRSSMNLMESH